MLLPLSAAAVMATVLLWELALPRIRESLPQLTHELAARRRARRATDRSRETLASGEHPVSASTATTPAVSCAPSSARASCCARA